MATTILQEEIHQRTDIELPVQDSWPTTNAPIIAIGTREGKHSWTAELRQRKNENPILAKPEGYAIKILQNDDGVAPCVLIEGADSNGAMFGVGRLLRELKCKTDEIKLSSSFSESSAPEYAIRGHEMGYRARSNTYDAWSPEQFEQYIREQILFGMNCAQSIPFEDTRTNAMMKFSREEMNREFGKICEKYDIDHWAWTPVEFSLKDEVLRNAELQKHEQFYRSTPRLDAVFVPGGDPGDNPPELLLSFMEDLALLLAKYHSQAKVRMSLQYFDEPKVQFVMDYISRQKPTWFGGIVADTSALPVGETRRRLVKSYPVLWYPDITHTVECQFPVSWWDPAYAVTLGREPTNPRPNSYTTIFRRIAPHTGGFVTYSDGVNDDLNKAVWSMLGWNSQQDLREMLLEYARIHFGDDVAEGAADALLGLENNWRGSLARNASVDGVLALWQQLEQQHPELLENWRFQQHLMRAYYDAYTRRRLIYESQLEQQALKILEAAPELGSDESIRFAEEILTQADGQPCRPRLRARLNELADALFHSIGYQTSVERYRASGAERGCVMDFVDRPLNDRWWLEDEFNRIRSMNSEQEKLARLETIRTWKAPGPGSFYDDIGHVGESPRVVRGEDTNTDPEVRRHANPGHSWVDDGNSRRRLAWLHHMRWPQGVSYDGLDSNARYVVRLTGQGESPLRGDGVRLPALNRAKEIGQFQEFSVPKELTSDGALLLTWDPVDDSHLHWTKHAHVAEVWLLKQQISD